MDWRILEKSFRYSIQHRKKFCSNPYITCMFGKNIMETAANKQKSRKNSANKPIISTGIYIQLTLKKSY